MKIHILKITRHTILCSNVNYLNSLKKFSAKLVTLSYSISLYSIALWFDAWINFIRFFFRFVFVFCGQWIKNIKISNKYIIDRDHNYCGFISILNGYCHRKRDRNKMSEFNKIIIIFANVREQIKWGFIILVEFNRKIVLYLTTINKRFLDWQTNYSHRNPQSIHIRIFLNKFGMEIKEK